MRRAATPSRGRYRRSVPSPHRRAGSRRAGPRGRRTWSSSLWNDRDLAVGRATQDFVSLDSSLVAASSPSSLGVAWPVLDGVAGDVKTHLAPVHRCALYLRKRVAVTRSAGQTGNRLGVRRRSALMRPFAGRWMPITGRMACSSRSVSWSTSRTATSPDATAFSTSRSLSKRYVGQALDCENRFRKRIEKM